MKIQSGFSPLYFQNKKSPANSDNKTGMKSIENKYSSLPFLGYYSNMPSVNTLDKDTNIRMEPYTEYIISDKCILHLADYELDLKSKEGKFLIANIKKGEKAVLGREGIRFDGMDNKVSRKHLELSKTFDGKLIARDLNSSNGSVIEPDVITKDINLPFKLKSGVKYFLPKDSSFQIGDYEVNLSDYSNIINSMKEGQCISLGRNPENGIPIENRQVSRYHMNIQKYNGGVIVCDLNSTNGTIYKGVKKESFDADYSNIMTTLKLEKNKKTLLPKDSQLYLGNDLAIDLRNKNILNLLDKKGEITIGRSNECDFLISGFYDMVSRKHLILKKTNDGIIAEDKSSLNGTYVVPKCDIKPFYNGTKKLNIAQGNIGDCYLLSSLYALSLNKKGQKIIQDMVKIDEDGNYIVKFHNRESYKIAPDELDGQMKSDGSQKRSVSGELGIKAIERAYAKMIKYSKLKNSDISQTMFMDIDLGGYIDNAMKNLAGLNSKFYPLFLCDYEKIFNSILNDGRENYLVNCCTGPNALYDKYVDPNRIFLKSHAYTITYIDPKNKRIGITNPHDTRYTIHTSYDDFKKYFTELYVTKCV